jgi:hypothetical protein
LIDEIQRYCRGLTPNFPRARLPRIYKPSILVSFDLPNRLSFRVREHAMVAADRGQTLDRESVRVRPVTAISGECNGCEDDAKKGKAQEIKAEPAAGLCDLDAISGHAKPFQYDRRICRLGRSSARASRRQAFLRRATFAHSALWNFFRSLSEAALTFVRLLPPDTTAAAREAG